MDEIVALADRFVAAARRRHGWFRFFVPLDGTAIALELKCEASGQISKLRVSDQQTAALEEKPRLRAMLIGAAENRLAMINLLLEEMDMPWEALRAFKHSACATGAIIEAADNRLAETRRAQETDDCA